MRSSAASGLMLGVNTSWHAACRLPQVSVGGQPVLVWNGGKQFIFEHQREKQVQCCWLVLLLLLLSLLLRWLLLLLLLSLLLRWLLLLLAALVQAARGNLPLLTRSSTCNDCRQEGDPEGWWAENFKTHHDSKPKGPTAISMDIQVGAGRTAGEHKAEELLTGAPPTSNLVPG